MTTLQADIFGGVKPSLRTAKDKAIYCMERIVEKYNLAKGIKEPVTEEYIRRLYRNPDLTTKLKNWCFGFYLDTFERTSPNQSCEEVMFHASMSQNTIDRELRKVYADHEEN
jgi:hypothetical protein